MLIDAKLNTSLDETKKGPYPSNGMKFERDQSDHAYEEESKTGHWNDRENAKYFAFLDKFKDRFLEKESRRQCKIFKALSQFIRTRNANQCRSHHHKMKKNFKTIEETLSSMMKKNPFLEAESKKYAEELSNFRIQAIINQQLNQPQIPKKSSWNHQQEGIKYRFCPEQPQKLKPTDFSNIPTQVSYFEQGDTNLGQGNYFNNYQQNNFSFFPELRTLRRYNSSYLESSERIRDKGWIQCHEIFTKWVNKVKTLIN